MTNATVPAESPAGIVPTPMFRWELPGKPTAIHVSLDLVDRLERETIEAFKAVTKRGSEIGGILLGRSAAAGRRMVLIEDFEHVECDYARGPLYMLADEDGKRFEQSLARIRARSGGLSVVGFFRSNTRRDLCLVDEDMALLDGSFPDPAHVCLLVKPFAMKPSTAALFFREDGQFAVREPYETFAFRRAEIEKNFANLIVKPDDPSLAVFNARPEPPARPAAKPQEKAAPPTSPKREERPQVTVAQPKDAPPPPKAAPPPPKKEEKPAAAAPLTFRREERPSITAAKPERPAGPVLVKKEEGPAVQPVEKPAPAPPPVKPEERPATPAVTVRGVTAPAPPAAKEPVKEEPKPAGAAKADPSPAPAKPQEKPAPAPEAVAAKPGLLANRWLWVAVIVLLLGGAAVYRFVFIAEPVEQAQADPLSLKVDRSAGQLLLSWNRNAAAIQGASRAVLTISDGDHREDVDLDLGSLRNGNISYSPMTNDVGFRLEVTDLKGGKSVSESMRVLAGRPSPAIPMQQAPQVPQKLTPVPASAPETQAAKQQPAPAAPAPAAEQPQEPTVTATTAVTAQPPKPESLAARLSAPPQEMLDMPSIQPQGSATVTPSSLPSSLTPVPAPAPQEPAARAAQTPPVRPPQTPGAKPAQTPAAQTPAAQTPAAQPRVGGVVEPASLIKRGATQYPALARQARISGTVRVEAVIGADGKVKSAKAISGPPLLRQSAVDSVKQWTYRPATLNGMPAETTTTVDLLFTPGAR